MRNAVINTASPVGPAAISKRGGPSRWRFKRATWMVRAGICFGVIILGGFLVAPTSAFGQVSALRGIPGDSDGDGDVDLDDYVLLADCVAGPSVPPDPTPPTTVDTCLSVFDFDGDGDLDLRDFAAFQLGFNPTSQRLAVSRVYPEVFQVIFDPAMPGQSVPRSFAIVGHNDAVDVVISLTPLELTGVGAVHATLSASPSSGIQVVSGSQDYGDIAAGAVTPRMFRIRTNQAPVGIHQLTLHVTHESGVQQLIVLLPVWAMNFNILDVPEGIVEGQVTTPMTHNVMSWTSPEQFDDDGAPTYFDLRSLSHTRMFAVPFFGGHWGEGAHGEGATDLVDDRGDGTFELSGRVTTKSGAPLAGFTVQITSPVHGTFTVVSDANGNYTFRNIPCGQYTFACDPPAALRGFYKASFDMRPKSYCSGQYRDYWKFPDLPQGGGGGGAAAGGGGETKKSVIAGGLVGIGTVALDLLTGPKTWGLTLVSLGASAAIGGGTAVGSDPVDMDIFYAGEEATIPALPMEETFSESVSMTFTIVQPPVGEQDFIIESEFEFVRFTTGGTYHWSASETLQVPIYLRLLSPAALFNVDTHSVLVTTGVATADGTAQTGGDVVVTAHLGRYDDSTGLGMGLLHDDGQTPDAVANDGIYSATLPVDAGQSLPLDVMIFGLKTGFEDHEIPSLVGQVLVPVS